MNKLSSGTIKKNKKARNKRQLLKLSANHETTVFAVTYSLEYAIQQTKEKVAKISHECREQNRKFRDREFDLFVNMEDCLYNKKKETFNATNIKRVTSICKKPQFFIDGVEPNDIKQGGVGDCWFVASLAVITNIPKLLETICVARDEEIGVYGFIFFKDGDWVSTVVDDQLFTTGKDDKGNFQLTFAIVGGWTGEGIEDITGGVYTLLFTTDILDKDKFWNDILKNVNNNLLLGCARFEFSDKDIKDLKGTISNHAYSILRTAETDDGIKLLQMRNPWGKTEWTGAWSDGSKEWTPERMIKLNHRFGDDGTFWMSYDDFLNYWDMVDMCRLFDSSWMAYITWINYNVVPRSKGKFKLSLPEECHLIIVLQQPDSRYFCDDPKYDYQLSFRVFKEGDDSTYLVRSRSTFPFASRSINHEVKLPAGDYIIIPHVTRETIPEPEKKSDENKDESKEKVVNIKDIEIEKENWELQLGLRIYSKCTGIKLEGDPGEFPKKKDKKDEKAEDKDPEVDTKVIKPKDEEEKDSDKKDEEKDSEKKDDEKKNE
ncbi:2665_t:CDS:2 [Dentiscutata heterogama]|uniref:2665_t:CDS:1 n=1 Tax=Dentiscutata heterogama TaxID=1316150 RepID=A0ACA9LX26_9GLOM|nr:2665_t:CDS:2 [Dentiscutata heterogama]